MFLRKSTRRYKDKIYTNYMLVESVHTAKGPRQKVVCSLGDLSPRPAKEWLALAHRVEDALTGQKGLLDGSDPEVAKIVQRVRQRQARSKPTATSGSDGEDGDKDLVTIHGDRVGVQEPRSAGAVHVGHQFWKRLGLEEILGGLEFSPRAVELTCAMVLNRLVSPKSEHAMPNWIRATAIGDLLGVDFAELTDAPLYRNLDRLHPNRVAIEKALAARERSLFNLDPTIFFYDLTSTYFEGQALANPKARRGYSRDQRPDCKQVVMGLAVGKEGFPLAHEVYAGNTQDRQTLPSMLDSLEKRVGVIKGMTVVVDRGMAYAENLAEIGRRELHYVVAARQPERDQWREEFEKTEGFEEVHRQPSPRNPFQQKSTVRVKRIAGETEQWILCSSSERMAKDRAIREKQESIFLVDIAKLQKRIADGRLVREVAIGEALGRLKERYSRVALSCLGVRRRARKLVHQPDAEKKAKAELLDGTYLLRTDRKDLSADEAWRIYITLTRAESAFRSMKTPLAERPIFHHLERRVETHIFLCLLAYHLLVAIETTLLRQDVHTSWATVRETLATHEISTIVLPTDSGAILKIRKGSTPEPDQVELYRQLDVPAELIRPRRTWIHPPH